MEHEVVDVVILGAGGAGMMCAIQAAQRGRRVVLLDHSAKLGGKILISGGGRCNFTNIGASPVQYRSENPHFCKSALSRFTPADFIEMVEKHQIPFHEKKLGQLFCDGSALGIVNLLQSECEKAGARFELQCAVKRVNKLEGGFQVEAEVSRHPIVFTGKSLVVATGGLSIPKIGATGFGYELARQFGLKVVPTRPALDGFTFSGSDTEAFRELAGVSLDCVISSNGVSFRENILFTHSGLSGPAALQASLHWNPGDIVSIDTLPGQSSFEWFLEKKRGGSRALVKNLLSELIPGRLADLLCDRYFPSSLPLPQVSEKALEAFCQKLHHWELKPSGTVGYGKAEVTRGGVDTQELSSKTMEAHSVPGLYFIGEVVDVTGWLGGYNFQWAWASGWAAGQVV